MVIIVLILIAVVEIQLSPRLDFSKKRVFLWYGKLNRKYVILF